MRSNSGWRHVIVLKTNCQVLLRHLEAGSSESRSPQHTRFHTTTPDSGMAVEEVRNRRFPKERAERARLGNEGKARRLCYGQNPEQRPYARSPTPSWRWLGPVEFASWSRTALVQGEGGRRVRRTQDEFREAGFLEAVMCARRGTHDARTRALLQRRYVHEVVGQPHAVHVRAADSPSSQIFANWPD